MSVGLVCVYPYVEVLLQVTTRILVDNAFPAIMAVIIVTAQTDATFVLLTGKECYLWIT